MDTNSQAIDRVRGTERIASLDIIRGIAILFILFMNIPWMGGYQFVLFDFRYPTWTTADYWSTVAMQAYLSGTQRGLLELLFGAGIMIMARRAMDPDGPVAVADLHYRRNLWLCVFGLANAFILLWPGDILLVYGLAAVFLFPFRRLRPVGQLGFAALLLAALLLNSAAEYREARTNLAKVEQATAAQARGEKVSTENQELIKEHQKQVERRTTLPASRQAAKEKIAEADKARHGSLVDYWKYQAKGWTFIMSNFFWYIEAEILATMLIGMALLQMGIMQGKARSSVYWAFLIGGYGLGIWLRAAEWITILQPRYSLVWQGIFSDVSRLAVTLGHVGLIHLALRSKLGRVLLEPFAAAGRMPLTVYLFTSFLMLWVVFAPWGLDLYGRWGVAGLLTVAAIVIGAEIVASNLWMRSFENGPLEWLWKSLAYERREPFRKTGLRHADAVPSTA
ncbi:MAG TPA: DUF418 domain-containing protein [Sphingomicrobium sp.]|nr:DUF418 domain-containing protein [Sphingomicrobium sp.]